MRVEEIPRWRKWKSLAPDEAFKTLPGAAFASGAKTCRNFHSRAYFTIMLSDVSHTIIAGQPEEWDFRRVTDDVLDYVDHWEYGRSAGWLVEEYEKWYKTRIHLPENSRDFKKWSGKTVAEILDHFVHLGNREEWPDVLLAVYESQRVFLQYKYFWLYHFTVLFPRPFLSLLPLPTDVVEFFRSRHNQEGFQILQGPPPGIGDQWCEAHFGVFYLDVKVNGNVGKTKFLSDGQIKLGKFYDEWCSKPGFPTGRAATLPYHHLKELAAYRLNRASWNFRDAKDFLKDYEQENRVANPADVLPKYSSSGGWSTAVKKAEARIEKLYPRPS